MIDLDLLIQSAIIAAFYVYVGPWLYGDEW